MGRDQVDRHEPLVQPDLGILEDGPDLDRKPLAAVAALMRPVVGEVIDMGRSAMRAERAITPADRAEMIDAALLVRQSRDHLVKAGKLLDHSRTSIVRKSYPRFSVGLIRYIIPENKGLQRSLNRIKVMRCVTCRRALVLRAWMTGSKSRRAECMLNV